MHRIFLNLQRESLSGGQIKEPVYPSEGVLWRERPARDSPATQEALTILFMTLACFPSTHKSLSLIRYHPSIFHGSDGTESLTRRMLTIIWSEPQTPHFPNANIWISDCHWDIPHSPSLLGKNNRLLCQCGDSVQCSPYILLTPWKCSLRVSVLREMGLLWVSPPIDVLSIPYIMPVVDHRLFPVIAKEPLT